MGFNSRIGAVVCLFAISAMPVFAGRSGPDRTDITILVYNNARVPAQTLFRAEEQASTILSAAGLSAGWVNCFSGSAESPAACHEFLGARRFVVRIVPRGNSSSDSVFGVAFLAEGELGKYSDVFFGPIQSLQQEVNMNPASLLGAVAAHELGHLLLGTHSHTSFGIMAPHWQAEELRQIGMGALRFNSEQASRMRSRIRGLADTQGVPQLALNKY